MSSYLLITHRYPRAQRKARTPPFPPGPGERELRSAYGFWIRSLVTLFSKLFEKGWRDRLEWGLL